MIAFTPFVGILAEAATQPAAKAHWAMSLLQTTSVAHVVLLVCVVSFLGLALGNIRVFGISLGIGGVLFSGIALAHFMTKWGFPLLDPPSANPARDWHVLHFIREFGLILFVYTIGVHVGPGFFSSLRKDGLKLNLLAAAIVTLGALVTVGLFFFAGIPLAAAVGLFSGATTNTPSLAAGQEALREIGMSSQIPTQGSAYAMAYPFGIMGIIITMLLIRAIYRINLDKEQEEINKASAAKREPMINMNIEIKNAAFNGRTIEKLPFRRECNLTISRVLQNGTVSLGLPNTAVQTGDVIHVVGTKEGVEKFRDALGTESSVDVREVHSPITYRKILVTKGEFVGKTVDELQLQERFGVTCTRLLRGDISIAPSSGVEIAYGDTIGVVGEQNNVNEAAATLGNSLKALNHPQIIPIFIAIALGVIAGSIEIPLPGLPAPVKLGLAGGPLVVALILSRISKIGPLIYYLPQSANLALRELGIVMFLAAVGLDCGGSFVKTLTEGDGVRWMAYATIITFLPIFIVGIFARSILKTNYMTVCGLLAGSMTDPPALAFAGQVTGSDSPSVAYSTVYPVTMILRIFFGQTLVLLLVKYASGQ
jgi:putative transport protein